MDGGVDADVGAIEAFLFKRREDAADVLAGVEEAKAF